MKKSELKKIIKEEIKNAFILAEFEKINSDSEENKESFLSKLYQWLIRGDLKKAISMMQNDPVLNKMEQNLKELEKELAKKILNDEKMLELIYQAIQQVKKQKEKNK